MPKSFLLKRKSTNTSTSKLQNQQKEHEDQKEESLTSEDRSIQSKILTESPKAPTDSSHVVFEAKDEFATPTASPVKYSPEQPFSIYSPFYGLPFPGVADNSHNNFHTYFNTLPSDFRYFHLADFRNSWTPNLGSAHQPAFNSDDFNGELAFSAPTKVILPNEMRQPYRCEQCGKIFKTKYTLAIHLKMPNHTFARPFVCNTCGKGFRLSSTLCRHKIIHTKEKPYKCHICEKAFNRSSTLKTHLRTHNIEKEFVCDRCGKGFHQKGNLRNHILIHTGEKPYKCSLCQKAFNKLSNLKFHMHVHAENSPYRCGVCSVTFSRRCDLKNHIHNAHSQNEADFWVRYQDRSINTSPS